MKPIYYVKGFLTQLYLRQNVCWSHLSLTKQDNAIQDKLNKPHTAIINHIHHCGTLLRPVRNTILQYALIKNRLFQHNIIFILIHQCIQSFQKKNCFNFFVFLYSAEQTLKNCIPLALTIK